MIRTTLDGVEREAILAAAGGTPAEGGRRKVVFAFHGRTNAAEQVRRYYDLEEAAKEPTLFIYPQALTQADGTFSWSDPGDSAGNLRDIALFDRLLDEVGRTYCVDPDRVFVTGHSLGASFAATLACVRGDRIRGVAVVGGGIQPTACAGEVAAMVIHNPKDKLVPVGEGRRALSSFLAQNGMEPQSARPAPDYGMNCRQLGPPDTPMPVLWCPHGQDHAYGGRFYPHNWPDAAGPAIMSFFAGLEQATAER